MRALIFILLCFLLSPALLAENMSPSQQELTVISTTGLSLRSAPNLTSKRLLAAPYGAKVEVLDDKNYGFDTVDTYHYYFQNDFASHIPVCGHWRKVKFKEKIGFMFGAYLIESYRDIVGKREDIALLFPNTSCDNNFTYHPNWLWFALQEDKASHSYEWKEISLNFCVVEDEITDSYCIAANKTDKDILCIVGSLHNLAKMDVQGNWFDFEEGSFFDHGQEKAIPRVDFFKTWGLRVDSLSLYGASPLYLQNGDRRQLLNAPDPASDLAPENPSYLRWVGDLDGDGKRDYIIHYGIDKMSTHMLYLSSKASGDKMIKKVATFWMGPCC